MFAYPVIPQGTGEQEVDLLADDAGQSLLQLDQLPRPEPRVLRIRDGDDEAAWQRLPGRRGGTTLAELETRDPDLLADRLDRGDVRGDERMGH